MKEELSEKLEMPNKFIDFYITIGPFNGLRISDPEIPLGYLEWIYSHWHWGDIQKESLKDEIERRKNN